MGRAYREFHQHFPRPGWVEHDAPAAMAYQTVDAVRAMEASSGVEPKELKADGGAVVNGWLMKFQADVLGVPVVLPEVSETNALGAAYLAGMATGTWSEQDVRAMWRQAALPSARSNKDDRFG